MNCDETPLKAQSASRKRIMSPTPQQSPQPPLEGMPRQRWRTRILALVKKFMRASSRGRCAAKLEQYLNDSGNVKVEIEELELLLGPEDLQVDLKYILMNSE